MTAYSDAAKAHAKAHGHGSCVGKELGCNLMDTYDAGRDDAFDAAHGLATVRCICGTPGLDYDGPDEECPIHGGPGPLVDLTESKGWSHAAIEWTATHPTTWAAAAYDAGHAAALATVTPVQPRVLTTAAELAALPPRSVVRDRMGHDWEKGPGYVRPTDGCFHKRDGDRWGTTCAFPGALVEDGPLTLLVPAAAVPAEPERLTADDQLIDPEVDALFDITQSMAGLDSATKAWIARYAFERWADA